MSRVANVNASAVQEAAHIFSTEAVAHSSNLLESLILQELDTGLYNRLNSLNGVVFDPLLEVEGWRHVQCHGIAPEVVHHKNIVAICCILIREQLAVFIKSNDIGEIEEGNVLVNRLAGGFCDIDVGVSDLG
jgi:hypothetical protein